MGRWYQEFFIFKRNHDHFEANCHFHFLISLSFAEIHFVKIVHVEKIYWKYLWICIFQTLNHFFLLFGGICSKCRFYKKKSILREDFLRTILTWANTPNRFFGFFFLFVQYLCSIYVFICVIGELRELCAKFWNFWINIHREIICQSWPLLTPFYSGPIVHWMTKSKENKNPWKPLSQQQLNM